MRALNFRSIFNRKNFFLRRNKRIAYFNLDGNKRLKVITPNGISDYYEYVI